MKIHGRYPRRSWYSANAGLRATTHGKNNFEDVSITKMDWPAQTPNLNPIKHIWHHLKGHIRRGKPVSTAREEL